MYELQALDAKLDLVHKEMKKFNNAFKNRPYYYHEEY